MAFTFYTKYQTDTLLASYLTTASASATYLTSATASATYLPKSGGTLSGQVYFAQTPDDQYSLVNRKYVDDAIQSAVFGTITNFTIPGDLVVDGTITGKTTITDGTTVSVVYDPVDGAEVVLSPGVHMCWIKVDGRSFSLGNFIFEHADTYALSSVFTIYSGINTSSSAQLIYYRPDNRVRVYLWAETDGLVSLTPYTDTYSTTMTIYFRKIT